MKIDLHCHSKYSKRPTLWLMQKIGCPESFTEPAELYRIAQKRGMDGVTITDHNVIDGALEIADLPNVVVGCEYTTYFPEDRCKVHILVYHLDENHHRELTKARENIFDLVDYVRTHNLPNICAHPFFWVNDRLTAEHIEQLALLFKNWELNGDISSGMNACVRQLACHLKPEDIARLSDKHGFEPHFPEPWKKNLTTGSDDHSSLHLANAYTEVPDAATLEEFWRGLDKGQAVMHSVQEASPQSFGRNVYGIAYQFYKDKFGLERYVNKDLLLRYLDRSLQGRSDLTDPLLSRLTLFLSKRRRPRANGDEFSLTALARSEAEKLVRNKPRLMALVNEGQGRDLDAQWFEFVNEVSNNVLTHFGGHVVDRVSKGMLFDLFHSIGSAGALYALLAPYFVSYSLFAKQTDFASSILEHFGVEPSKQRPAKVAHFTDTFHAANGVAQTLQQQLTAARRLHRDYTIVTCHAERAYEHGVRQFMPVGAVDVPGQTGMQLLMPPLLQMLDWCYREGITHIHVSTPGPVGLAALGIARILGLPISGTYHSSAIPEFVKTLTEDSYVEDMSWKYMLWFHNQLDAIYAPAHAVAESLVSRGLDPAVIRVYPRGVDHDRFTPDKRSGALRRELGASGEKTVLLLYSGRIAERKGLSRLAEAYRRLADTGADVRLVIAGEGPYGAALEKDLDGLPVVFMGTLHGEKLARLYASCDLLVFPSVHDTMGNAVLEAQASGLPVIVTDQGGASEHMACGETGLVAEGGTQEALFAAMQRLVLDGALRQSLSQGARNFAQQRDLHAITGQLLDMYTGETSSADAADPRTGALFNVLDGARALAS